IAAYTHPMDLLNLARTCKSLRQLLMHKSSAFVWKVARCQVDGLPDCPPDLTEPEYANLLFYARCHARTDPTDDCGKRAKSILWRMRRRYCPDCRIERYDEFHVCFNYRFRVHKQIRFCSLSSCHKVIRSEKVLATEQVSIEGGMLLDYSKHLATGPRYRNDILG
ncbi:hypothetical protein OG21DRAFT_1421103, partial [Imleria badia]